MRSLLRPALWVRELRGGIGSVRLLHLLGDIVACSGMPCEVVDDYDDSVAHTLQVSLTAFQYLVRAVLRGTVREDRLMIIVR